MHDIFITKEGLEKLKEELRILKEVKVPDVVKRIQVARDNGDLSENADYEQAKNEQSMIEGKILELEDIIKNAKVSGRPASLDQVSVGAKVKVHIDGNEEVLTIVGALEANPMERKISHESPIGAALIGKKRGEKIEVDAPVGKLTYTILDIF